MKERPGNPAAGSRISILLSVDPEPITLWGESIIRVGLINVADHPVVVPKIAYLLSHIRIRSTGGGELRKRVAKLINYGAATEDCYMLLQPGESYLCEAKTGWVSPRGRTGHGQVGSAGSGAILDQVTFHTTIQPGSYTLTFEFSGAREKLKVGDVWRTVDEHFGAPLVRGALRSNSIAVDMLQEQQSLNEDGEVQTVP